MLLRTIGPRQKRKAASGNSSKCQKLVARRKGKNRECHTLAAASYRSISCDWTENQIDGPQQERRRRGFGSASVEEGGGKKRTICKKNLNKKKKESVVGSKKIVPALKNLNRRGR